MNMLISELNIKSIKRMKNISQNYPIGSVVGFFVNEVVRFGKVIDYSCNNFYDFKVDIKEFGEDGIYRRVNPDDHEIGLFRV